MPENETLFHDVEHASRWRSISDRLDGGQASTEAFPEIQFQFYSRLRRVWQVWKGNGVDPAQLFEAARSDRRKLAELIKLTHGDRHARLLGDVASGMQDPAIQDLKRAFLEAEWDAVRVELQLDRREEAWSPEFMTQVESMLGRILRCLLSDSSRIPPCPPRKGPPPDLDDQLRESLL